MVGAQSSPPFLSRKESTPLARSVLSLLRIRSFVRGRMARTLALAIAAAYAGAALWAGAMLQFVPTGASGISVQVLESSGSHEWWNFPALFVVAPGGVLVLPWFATLTMIVVSVGVGWGMSAGLLFAIRVVRAWRRERSGAGIASSLAGLSPALVAGTTLGACCSTTATAVGGLEMLAAATGVSVSALTVDTWYLNLFQIGVLALALLGQETLLLVFERFTSNASHPSGTRGRISDHARVQTSRAVIPPDHFSRE